MNQRILLKAKLEALKIIPTESIVNAINELGSPERGIELKAPDEAKEKRLNAIKEEGRVVTDEIRDINDKLKSDYNFWIELKSKYDSDVSEVNRVVSFLNDVIIPDEFKDSIYSSGSKVAAFDREKP